MGLPAGVSQQYGFWLYDITTNPATPYAEDTDVVTQVSVAGGAWEATDNSATHVGDGYFVITLSASEMAAGATAFRAFVSSGGTFAGRDTDIHVWNDVDKVFDPSWIATTSTAVPAELSSDEKNELADFIWRRNLQSVRDATHTGIDAASPISALVALATGIGVLYRSPGVDGTNYHWPDDLVNPAYYVQVLGVISGTQIPNKLGTMEDA